MARDWAVGGWGGDGVGGDADGRGLRWGMGCGGERELEGQGSGEEVP